MWTLRNILCSIRQILGKSELFFKKTVSWFESVEKGDGSIVDPELERILARKPLDGVDVVKILFTENPNYIWKQNYVR